jgi:hypothetical protein
MLAFDRLAFTTRWTIEVFAEATAAQRWRWRRSFATGTVVYPHRHCNCRFVLGVLAAEGGELGAALADLDVAVEPVPAQVEAASRCRTPWGRE